MNWRGAERRDAHQGDLFKRAAADDAARALIDQLIADTRLYDSAAALRELLDFTARFRHVAPFNAMLLHIQKPGLSFAATRDDWWNRFRRPLRPGSRPLVVLRNFGPVDFVYDVLDTEGEPLPEAAYAFPTGGSVPADWLDAAERRLGTVAITLRSMDNGDYSAGYAQRLTSHGERTRFERFEVGINRNHPAPTRAVTLFHELAHIFLGHCGPDVKRGIRDGVTGGEALHEVEAETAAWLVAKRTGLAPRSESYLDRYKGAFDAIDLHRVMRAANAVEKVLDLPFPSHRLFA